MSNSLYYGLNWECWNFRWSNLIFTKLIGWNHEQNWKKIKVYGQLRVKLKKFKPKIFLQKTCKFRDSIWLKTRVKLKKFEVWRSIRDKIENIQDQRPSWKTRWNHEMFLKHDRGKIEVTLTIKIQLRN